MNKNLKRRGRIRIVAISSRIIQPACVSSLIDIGIDLATNIVLIYAALKVSAPAMWVFLIFSLGQALGAPGYGVLIHFFGKKGPRLFSLIVTAVATLLGLEASGILSRTSYTQLLGLSDFSPSLVILVILGVKSLLTGVTVIAKATIAEEIKLETVREQNTT